MSSRGASRGNGPFAVERAPLFGVYTGYIRDVDDPDTRGRIRVYCPTVMGDTDSEEYWLPWALPCFAWVVNTGTGKPGAAGFIPASAQPGSDKWGVHVQFREGDVRFPVWMGVFSLNELDTDDLVFEATKKLTLKVGSNTVVIDGDTNTVTINGDTHPLPLFDTFETQLSTWCTNILTVLAAGTSGSPAAQQLTALPGLQVALQTFVTNLGNKTFESTKAKNG